METATFPFELDTQAGKESVLQYGYLTLSVAREIQEQGYCCLHWQCGKNSPAASVPAAASSGKSRDGYSQVFYCSFLQKVAFPNREKGDLQLSLACHNGCGTQSHC